MISLRAIASPETWHLETPKGTGKLVCSPDLSARHNLAHMSQIQVAFFVEPSHCAIPERFRILLPGAKMSMCFKPLQRYPVGPCKTHRGTQTRFRRLKQLDDLGLPEIISMKVKMICVASHFRELCPGNLQACCVQTKIIFPASF